MNRVTPIQQLEHAALDVQAAMRDLTDSFEAFMWAHQRAVTANEMLAAKNNDLRSTIYQLRYRLGEQTQGIAA